ncbi:MAG: polysaccharide deacetylase [Paenibacillaceae bacterium]|jgi:chitin deacetylase|nr:polysaccharide deacetylase [Paenibacillaceae bacterium]
MVFKSPSYIKQEIEDTDRLIRETGYKGTIQFRPPYGKKLLFLPYYLKQNGRNTITWDLEPETDPRVNASSETIIRHVVDNVKPGSIILLHPMYDGKGNTLNAIKGIIKGLQDQDYIFKTVNELLEYRN